MYVLLGISFIMIQLALNLYSDLGSSNGIGLETARVLALRGVHVIMAVRNVKAGEKVKAELLKKMPDAKIDVMALDLNSQASIRKFVEEYISSSLPLNILV